MDMPTRAQFVEAARTYALAYGRQDDAPNYLPRTVNDAQAFEPHAWVIGAMMQAWWDALAEGRSIERAEAPKWQPISTAPQDGTPVIVSWPLVRIDDEGELTGEVVGRRTLTTEMNCGHWLEPDVCNAVGDWFGDDYEYAEQPDLWMPVPASPAV